MKNPGILLLASFMLVFIACQKSHLSEEICDCAATPTVCQIDGDTLFIPNIFTPNGDGKNDEWTIRGIYLLPDYDIKIMNTGMFPYTVFHSKNYFEGWTGKDNGVIKGGKYKYIITLRLCI